METQCVTGVTENRRKPSCGHGAKWLNEAVAASWPGRQHLGRSLDHAVETVHTVETGGGDRLGGIGGFGYRRVRLAVENAM
jgi:hypothetical protein